mgnify:CR=1 FL=1
MSSRKSMLLRVTAAVSATLLSATAFAQPFAAGSTQQDFDNPGTNFGTFGSATTAGAVTGDAGQLTAKVNNQNGRIGFDQSLSSTNFNLITGSFDFRADPTTNNSNQADGFSLLFLNTANHGTSGDFSTTSAAEIGQATGSLGIGFNIHQGGSDLSNNSIYVNNDQAPASATQVNAPFDMSTPEFHRALFSVEFLESGDALVDLSLIEDINGTAGAPQVVYNDLLVSGLSPYDFRVGFAGRTGGQNALQQIDNINIAAVQTPEPGSIAMWSILGLAGFAGIYWRKRKVK